MHAKRLAPLAIAAATVLILALLYATRPTLERVEPERAIPTVRVVQAMPQTLRHLVRSQGTVAPRTEANLVAEVSGRVLWIAPSFASGGFFDVDAPLVRLDPRDYELALERAEAQLRRARSELDFAAAELARQEGLSTGGVASVSQLADARRAANVAEASQLDARAALEQSERDLSRTEIRAPFAGRIREANVDIGQFVNRGAPLARVYATDYAEIRLPIPDDQLAFLDIGPPRPGLPLDVDRAPVRLSAQFAGQLTEWNGYLVRTEGEIDQRSRMVNIVARVEDPYRSGATTAGVPLAVGLFVHAEISGPEVDNVIVVPRYAMHDGNHILVVDANDRLHRRTVEVLRIDRDEVLVVGPLAEGERVCLSPLQVVVEGMQVRAIEDDMPRADLPGAPPT